MVGHFLINRHMGAFVFVVNIAKHKSIPKINLIWDLKVLAPYLHVKDLGMAIWK